MPDVRVVSSTEAGSDPLDSIHRVVLAAFESDFAEGDWEHTVGGWHVVVEDDGFVVAHAAVVERMLHVGNRPFHTGYIEGVATEPSRWGQGLGTTAMRAASDVVRRDFDLGALSTGAHGFYEAIGWERWQGPTFVHTRDGTLRTGDEDDGIMVLRHGTSAGIDLTAAISCEARPGDDW